MTLSSRTVFRWYSRRFPPPLVKNVLATSNSIKTELLSAFQLYSEVRDLGYQILRLRSHANLNASFFRLQSYIRHGVSFYNTAETLHYRASPLLYYYSFLNFAKAAIFVRDPSFTSGHINHGLNPSNSTGMLRNHSVQVRTGVFTHLYYHSIGQKISTGARFTIVALLGYVSDVAFEYKYLNFDQYRCYNYRLAIVQHLNERTSMSCDCSPRSAG